MPTLSAAAAPRAYRCASSAATARGVGKSNSRVAGSASPVAAVSRLRSSTGGQRVESLVREQVVRVGGVRPLRVAQHRGRQRPYPREQRSGPPGERVTGRV
ncbi:hypothetical protein GTY54_47695, partial [Streptomyces sp. SID625]|nr:hypothetical protein [Streptomyces sp. SID625]